MDFLKLIPVIGPILSTIGAVISGGESRSASANAGRKSATEEELMKEYLEDYRAMRPTRKHLQAGLEARASSKPFYSATWGRYNG